MQSVRDQISAWEQRQAPLSDELQRFLDLVWSHRKNQKTRTYAADNVDVYGLYARVQKNFNYNPYSVQWFLQDIARMGAHLHLWPEIQCTVPSDQELADEKLAAKALARDPLGFLLKTDFNATSAPSGFTRLTPNDFQRLSNESLENEYLWRKLGKTFYHFRVSLAGSSQRIYLHTKPLYATRVMDFVIREMLLGNANHPPRVLNAKVSAPGVESRFDTIVIYLLNEAAIEPALDKIAAYQALPANRNLFEHGATRATKLIHNHGESELTGVGIGAEPPFALVRTKRGLQQVDRASSFGTVRSQLITFALEETLAVGEGKAEFVERVVTFFKWARIDPRQPHTHIS